MIAKSECTIKGAITKVTRTQQFRTDDAGNKVPTKKKIQLTLAGYYGFAVVEGDTDFTIVNKMAAVGRIVTVAFADIRSSVLGNEGGGASESGGQKSGGFKIEYKNLLETQIVKFEKGEESTIEVEDGLDEVKVADNEWAEKVFAPRETVQQLTEEQVTKPGDNPSGEGTGW